MEGVIQPKEPPQTPRTPQVLREVLAVTPTAAHGQPRRGACRSEARGLGHNQRSHQGEK